jgi:hypothetical protein
LLLSDAIFFPKTCGCWDTLLYLRPPFFGFFITPSEKVLSAYYLSDLELNRKRFKKYRTLAQGIGRRVYNSWDAEGGIGVYLVTLTMSTLIKSAVAETEKLHPSDIYPVYRVVYTSALTVPDRAVAYR